MERDAGSSSPPAYGIVKLLSWIVLAILVIAMIYAGWLSLSNWAEIRV